MELDTLYICIVIQRGYAMKLSHTPMGEEYEAVGKEESGVGSS